MPSLTPVPNFPILDDPTKDAILKRWLSNLETVTNTLVSSTVIAVSGGGTGITSYAVGDLLTAATTSSLSKLPDVATGNALISGGVGVVPVYGKIGLTTHINGTLAVANGGTGSTAIAAGQIVYGNGTNPIQVTTNLYYDVSTLVVPGILVSSVATNIPGAGQGFLAAAAGGGLLLRGNGTTGDVTIQNRNGSAALRVIANTQNVSSLGSLGVTNDISVGSGNLILRSTGDNKVGTDDATNVSRLFISSGGSYGDVNKGAFLLLGSVSSANPGLMQFTAGNVTGGSIDYYTSNAQLRLQIVGDGTMRSFSTFIKADSYLERTTVALTTSTATSTATMTNSPVAGNPTKWIPIDDNNTTRWIPCW